VCDTLVPQLAWQKKSCSACYSILPQSRLSSPETAQPRRENQGFRALFVSAMALRGAFFVGLLAAAWVNTLAGTAAPLPGLGRELRGTAAIGIAACGCMNLECRCEMGGNASSEDTAAEEAQSLERVKQLAAWWGQHMGQAKHTACSCMGSACYCSRAGNSEHAQLGHASCICSGSGDEACRCGHAQRPGAESALQVAAAEPATNEAEEQLIGQTKQVSKFWGRYGGFGYHPGGFGGYHPGGFGGYSGHACHCYHHFFGHVCHCIRYRHYR